jgi:DNA-binding MarR family transcriptional regulator
MVEGYTGAIKGIHPEEILSALESLREASLVMRRLEDHFALHGLSQVRFLVMVVIDREPDIKALTHGQIAERLDVSKPVVTRTLKTLMDAAMIEPVRLARTGPKKHYQLTAQGRDKLLGLMPSYFERLTVRDPTP